MRITNIHIFAFGKHENLQLTFGHHINVLYGENEAGKTTIQQFILHVLFGFPPRNHSLLRYEPLHSNTYGGQVHIEDEQYGCVVVERVGGKSSGDVTVYYEDGTTGDETDLQKILRQYDRAAFEAIFSFSLLQLQGFEKMDEQTLSRTLFASGTTGIDELLKIESKMEKELAESYKRYGKKPVINEQIQKIQQLEKERLHEREKSARYEEAINRIEEIDRQLFALTEEQRLLKEHFEHARLQQQLTPLYNERRTLEGRLQKVQGGHFPTDGVTRYESLHYQLNEAKATEKAIQDQLEYIDKQYAVGLEAETIAHFEHFLQNEAEWHRLRSTLEQCRSTYKQLQTEQAQLLTRLGIQSEDDMEQLSSANASIQQEEEMYTLLEQMEACQKELNDVERTLAKQQQAKEQLIEKQRSIQQPDEHMIEQVQQWPKLQQRLADAKAFVMLQGGQAKQLQMMKMIGYIIVGILFVIGLLSQQWFLMISSISLLVVLLIYTKQQHGMQSSEEAERTIAEIEPLAQEIGRYTDIVQTFEREEAQIRNSLALVERELAQLTEQQSALQQEQAYTNRQLTTFLQQYGITTLPSAKLIPELFRLIRNVQETMREMKEIQAQGKTIKHDITQWLDDAQQQLAIEANEQTLYEQIRQAYQVHIRAQEQQISLAERRAHYEQQLSEIRIVIETTSTQITQLFKEAAVDSEEAYYAMYEAARERSMLQEQLRSIVSQLDVYAAYAFDWTLTMFSIDETVEQTKTQLEKLDEKRQQLVEEKAQLTHETNDLLSDETYRALVQEIEVEKANLAALTQEWAMKKAIATAIVEMMEQLKEERFPAVLHRANRYFEQLTGERYTALHITEEGLFEAERQDGVRFSIMTLSQATKEQAYIALRFALATTIQEAAPFPIIMDDPFVHFDEQRLLYMVQLLQQLTSTQFIYFTCHAHMTKRFDHATTMTISELEQKEGTKQR